MENKDFTPNKSSKIYPNLQSTNVGSYSRPLAEFSRNATGETALLKQYQNLKLQVKHLEVQNRQLSSQLEKVRYEKNINQSKYLQKVNFEEEAISQFQKEKNYQIELLKIKNQEDLNKLRREYEIRQDEALRELKNRDYINRQLGEKNNYFELKNNELKKEVDNLQLELVKFRDANSQITQRLTKEEFSNKKLEMLVDQLERQKCQMEAEIHVLLDIEAEKSRNINSLEIQLHNSQNTQRCLQQKLTMLTDNFASLEQHISIMKERLLSTQVRNQELDKQLQCAEMQIQDDQRMITEQKDREGRLRAELEQSQLREVRREKEVNQLMSQNERLYRQLNLTRHKLHEVCISQGIDI